VDGQTINWGVLQAIGAAGLVTLGFIRTSPWLRLAVGALILAAYQFLLDSFWLGTVLASPHGGLLGSISWAGMLLLATVLADLFYSSMKNLHRLNFAGFLLVLAGLALTFWFPVSKNRVSAPYVLLSLGLSGMIFYTCQILVEKFHLHSRLLVLWGRNPLVLYMLHMLLLGIVYLPDVPVLYSQAPLWLVIIEAVLLLGGLTWAAWWMDRAKIYFSV
jgi:predicted acyltransferase